MNMWWIKALVLDSDGTEVLYWTRLLISALAIRVIVVFVCLGQMPLVADAESYSQEARKLLESFPGTQPYFWPPGMSYLMALTYGAFSDSLIVARIIAILVSLANVLMVGLVSRQVLRNLRASRIAGWIAALYPPDVMMSGQTFAYPLTALCLLSTVYCLLEGYKGGKLRWFLLAGGAMGWGVLTRPSILAVLGAFPCAWLLARWYGEQRPIRIPWTGVGTFVAVVVLCVSPVLLYNSQRGGGLTVSTNNEWNFFLGNNRYTHHYKTSQFGQRSLNQLPPDVAEYFKSFLVRADARPAMMAEAWRYVWEHPFVTGWRVLSRVRAFWGFDHTMARQIQYYFGLGDVELFLLLAIEAGGYCLVAVMFIFGVWSAQEMISLRRGLLLLLFVAGYQLPYTLAFSSSVYHVSVLGLLLPFAGAGVEQYLRNRAAAVAISTTWRRALVCSLLVFAFIQAEYAYYLFAMR